MHALFAICNTYIHMYPPIYIYAYFISYGEFAYMYSNLILYVFIYIFV